MIIFTSAAFGSDHIANDVEKVIFEDGMALVDRDWCFDATRTDLGDAGLKRLNGRKATSINYVQVVFAAIWWLSSMNLWIVLGTLVLIALICPRMRNHRQKSGQRKLKQINNHNNKNKRLNIILQVQQLNRSNPVTEGSSAPAVVKAREQPLHTPTYQRNIWLDKERCRNVSTPEDEQQSSIRAIHTPGGMTEHLMGQGPEQEEDCQFHHRINDSKLSSNNSWVIWDYYRYYSTKYP